MRPSNRAADDDEVKVVVLAYFTHPIMLGPRIAKEFLFTGDRITAARCYELGMVNCVVPATSWSLRRWNWPSASRRCPAWAWR
jgi:enoyl-CoA hydratase/carnithine racemase